MSKSKLKAGSGPPPLADRFACQLWARVVLDASYLDAMLPGAQVSAGRATYQKEEPGVWWRLVLTGDEPRVSTPLATLLALVNRERMGQVAKRMELSDLSAATAAGVLRKIMRGERPLVRFGKADRFAGVLGCDVSALFAEPEIAALQAWRKWCAL